MSNVARDRYEPVAGETRYQKYYRRENERIMIIVLSNYSPRHHYWSDP